MKRHLILLMACAVSCHSFGECSMDGNQLEMNQCADEQYQTKKEELEFFYKHILEKAKTESDGDGPLPSDIEKSQVLWLTYAKKHCELLGSYKGSMSPMIYSTCLRDKYKERFQELNYYVCHPALAECEM